MPKNNDLQAILFDEKKITELIDNEKNRSNKIELIQEIPNWLTNWFELINEFNGIDEII